MAYEESVRCISVVPGAAIERYRYVRRAADGEVDKVGTSGLLPDGVAMEPATAQGVPAVIPMAVLDGGVIKVEAGASFARGDRIQADATGRAITFTATVGHNSCGVALEAGVVGQICSIQSINGGANVGT